MIKNIPIALLIFLGSFHAGATTNPSKGIPIKKIIAKLKKEQEKSISIHLLEQITPEMSRENPKVVALILTGTLGVFGAHRIYLGTDPKIPIFYTVTLGGGLGVLPAIDFLAILFTKDLSKYYHNDKIFMWSE